MLFLFKSDVLAAAASVLHSLHCRAFDRGTALKEENGEAVCLEVYLSSSQEIIDLAFGKCLPFFLVEKWRFSFHLFSKQLK